MNDEAKILEWWSETQRLHLANRLKQEEDSRFCDGEQWTPEERYVLETRGQAPLVFNNILRIIRWYKGTFSEMKMDWQVLPRNNSDVKAADFQTKVFKYISDKHNVMQEWGAAFEDAIRVGIGWVEYGRDQDDFAINYIDWREMYWDINSIKPDLRDAKYIFRAKYVKNDVLSHNYPSTLIFADSNAHSLLLECWYKVNKDVVKYAILTGDGQFITPPTDSPYPAGKFPYIPIWAYRDGLSKLPYGITRNIKDAQTDLNKRRSKALSLLISKQAVIEAGAISDISDFEEELARPDGIIVKNSGFDLEITDHINIAKEHIELADEDKQYIKDIAGLSDEILGETTKELSGEAISLKQRQAYIATKEIFENLQSHIKSAGNYLLQLSAIYMKNTKFSVITEKSIEEVETYSLKNQTLLDHHVDFIVSLRPFAYSERRAQFAMMSALLQNLEPDVVLNLLDLLIESTDFAMKDEMVDRIRLLNKQGKRALPESTRSASTQSVTTG